MLKMRKDITLSGSSFIDGVIAEEYQATINGDNPEDLNISSWQADKAIYKANRAQCYLDRKEFEDAVYALQDEMIAEKAAQETA